MPYFQNERFRMHYEVVRGAVPSDTLLIHGNLASNRWWEPAIEAWGRIKSERAEGSWSGNLILAEWRGCGKTPGPRPNPIWIFRFWLAITSNFW